ncbi:MAG TPA: hypothetical protein VFN31_00420 [Candidatus Saccharimonadales bacterium]|nr:hypothetical protein [Candidatus Saccharimonadales bacterium]
MSEIESSLRLSNLDAETEIQAAQTLRQLHEEDKVARLTAIEEELMLVLKEEERDCEQLPRPVFEQLISKIQARKYFPGEPPVQTAFNHYSTRIFLWDTELIVEVLASIGSEKIVDWAARSLDTLTAKMNDNGFIPNMQYLAHYGGLHLGAIAERLTFTNREGSDYSQPYLLPTAIKAVFEGYLRLGNEQKAWSFLEDMYPKAKLHGEYFRQYRSSSQENPLIYNIHPHEDGRDNHGKFKLKRFGSKTPLAWDYLDVAQDFGLTYLKNLRLRRIGWDPMRARGIYGRRDTMFNSIMVKDSRVMRDIARLLEQHEPDAVKQRNYKNESAEFDAYAQKLEHAIFKYMWHEDDVWSPRGSRTHKGLFRSIKGNGQPEEEIDAGDLMSLILENLKANQLVSLVNLIFASFNTPYGIPGTPTDSFIADFHYERRTGCNWDAIWPHIQKILCNDGLRMQADRIERDPKFRAEFKSQAEARQTQYLCNVIADMAARRTKELTAGHYAEMYDPYSGTPQRYPHVKRFGMAMQAEIFDYYGLDIDDRYFKLCRRLGRIVNRPYSDLFIVREEVED